MTTTTGMNASQLHLWVLKNLDPLVRESGTRVGELVGTEDGEARLALEHEAGHHKGLHEAVMLLLDLVKDMQEQERAERERVWALGSETLFERQDREWREAMSNIGGSCPGCHGSGEGSEPLTFNGLGTCHVCAGTGKVNPRRAKA